MLHRPLKRIGAAQLRVDDNEPAAISLTSSLCQFNEINHHTYLIVQSTCDQRQLSLMSSCGFAAYRHGQADKQDNPSDQPGLFECVRLSDDSGATTAHRRYQVSPPLQYLRRFSPSAAANSAWY